jgi:hypothetical protein
MKRGRRLRVADSEGIQFSASPDGTAADGKTYRLGPRFFLQFVLRLPEPDGAAENAPDN